MPRIYLDRVQIPLSQDEKRYYPALPFNDGDRLSYIWVDEHSDEKELMAHIQIYLRKIGKEYGSVYISIHGTPRKPPEITWAVDPFARVGDDDLEPVRRKRVVRRTKKAKSKVKKKTK